MSNQPLPPISKEAREAVKLADDKCDLALTEIEKVLLAEIIQSCIDRALSSVKEEEKLNSADDIVQNSKTTEEVLATIDATATAPTTQEQPPEETGNTSELLESCMELRDSVAAAFRVISSSDDPQKLTDALEAELRRSGIQDGFGLRAQCAIAKAQSDPLIATAATPIASSVFSEAKDDPEKDAKRLAEKIWQKTIGDRHGITLPKSADSGSGVADFPRHDDLENPPDYVTLRDDYWALLNHLSAPTDEEVKE